MFNLENNLKLEKEEKVLIVVRPGWNYYIFNLVIFSLLILIPSFFYFFLITQGIYGIVLLITIPSLAIFYGIRMLIIYYYNVYIFTNERIIGIDQKGFFDKLIMIVKLKDIKKIDFFKKRSLCVELASGKNLILDKIDEREYIYEVLREQTNKWQGSNSNIEFIKRKI